MNLRRRPRTPAGHLRTRTPAGHLRTRTLSGPVHQPAAPGPGLAPPTDTDIAEYLTALNGLRLSGRHP